MADDDVNEDQWLYGDSNPDKSEDAAADDNLYGDKFDNSQDSNAANQLPPVLEPPIIEPPQKNFNATENSNHDKPSDSTNEVDKLPGDVNKEKKIQEDGEEEEEEDGEVDDSNKNDAAVNSSALPRAEDEEDDEEDDDSEDDVNVVIGEIKTSSQYTIKRGVLSSGPQLKQPGKFSIEEFETIGTINGIPAHDFSLDSLEDKPWRKPGADITDYFNYGFNEETWRAYCERQKRMRVQESGVGLGQLSSIAPQVVNQATAVRGSIPVTIVNDNSKYAAAPGSIAPAVVGQRKAGPPPGRRVAGSIDVLGNSNLNTNRGESPPKGNVIQVMTADRREYSRKTGFPDMSLPPPGIPPPGFEPGPPFGPDYGGEYYNSEMDPYYQAYEPTQDSQWANAVSGWDQEDMKVAMPPAYVPPTGTPHVITSEASNQDSQEAADKSNSTLPGGITIKQERDTSKERERERDRDRDRDRERERDRSERERDRPERHSRSHRHRSRSRSTERRSRKHKSRSRSPGHRSHKKKKSKKSDRAKEESD